MKAYLIRHLQVFVSVIGQLARAPGSTLLSTAAIGVTLALPGFLHVMLDNIQTLSGGWQHRAPVSLFREADTPTADLERLAEKLRQRRDVESVTAITAEQALLEFQQQSGLAEALDVLGHNPLPATIVVYLRAEELDGDLDTLLRELGAIPGVTAATSDVQWLRRLSSMIDFLRRMVLILATLLAFAVVVIISNTIRLAILSRREEIEIIKLVGGSNRFVRRPFLYSGLVQGLLGAVLALVIITGALHLLAPPVADLGDSYGLGLALTGLRIEDGVLIVLAGGLLGWLASRLSVAWHLARIEPR